MYGNLLATRIDGLTTNFRGALPVKGVMVDLSAGAKVNINQLSMFKQDPLNRPDKFRPLMNMEQERALY